MLAGTIINHVAAPLQNFFPVFLLFFIAIKREMDEEEEEEEEGFITRKPWTATKQLQKLWY
jgi:hypothetical protein